MSPRWRLDIGAVFVFLALGGMFSALPRYVTEDLGGTRATAGFAVSVFFLTAVVARPLAGRMIDRRGRQPLLTILPFVAAAVTLAMTLAGSVPLVIALRLVQGVAGGAFYVVAVTTETDLAPANRRASAVARLSIAIYLGFAAGPALGEVLFDSGATITWLVLAAVAATGGLLTSTVPETRPAPVPAAAAAGPSGEDDGEPSRPERRVPFIYPTSVLPGITLLGLGVGYTSITALSALYAREIGLESSEVLYASYALTILVVRLVSGRLADAVGPVKVMFPGLASFVAGFTLMSLVREPLPAAVGVALVGLGWALVFPAVISWVASQVPDAERGAALGTLMAFMDIGQGSGGYVVGAVADGAGFGWAYAVPASLAVVGAGVLAVAIRRVGPISKELGPSSGEAVVPAR